MRCCGKWTSDMRSRESEIARVHVSALCWSRLTGGALAAPSLNRMTNLIMSTVLYSLTFHSVLKIVTGRYYSPLTKSTTLPGRRGGCIKNRRRVISVTATDYSPP